MKNLFCFCVSFLFLTLLYAQPKQLKAEKYPSLLWEITGKGLPKKSYLFGTMHVSNKMVFNLSDSFYLGIRNAQIVALETNPATWQEDFSRYDLEGEGALPAGGRFAGNSRPSFSPQDFITENTLKFTPYEKIMEAALYSNPSILNSFLYRSNAEGGSDFEEDTYLDLHIFQTGRKLGKKICGVEDFHGSMQLVKEAYADAAKEKRKKRGFDYDDDFSYARMEEAYRTGNLDLLDTINKVNSQSAAFDEKFLYRRNDIQAASIDSILKTGAALFVGVGAAHLPGERGVIEILRKLGYKLRPMKMNERDSRHKERIEKIRVPVQFSRQVSDDAFYSVMVPGKLFGFGKGGAALEMKQFADMVNGSYYMVTRIFTNAAIQGQTEPQVQRKLDSVLYENIPGKILVKKPVLKNGYHGYDITNRTRRGDIQRYNIFITPFEVLIFKMSGNGDYVKLGTEAEQFFGSIQLKEHKTAWKKWTPTYGGFTVDMPHQPLVFSGHNRAYAAYDAISKTALQVIHTSIHNYDFLEEDAFDLSLMEESFAASQCIDTCLSRRWAIQEGYKALDARYRYKDGTIASVRFLIQGPHYYTIIAASKTNNQRVRQFMHSFSVIPFQYREAERLTDTATGFTVMSPVALEKTVRLAMYPTDLFSGSGEASEDSLVNKGTYKSRLIENDSTGEKIFVAFYKPSPYYQRLQKTANEDSTAFKKEWLVRSSTTDTLANGMVISSYELGNTKSSRMLKGKTFSKNGMGYTLETQLDTVSKESAFIHSFFESFQPLDTVMELDIFQKKSSIFFRQFFSGDTTEHKRAVKNISSVRMDSTDFPSLKNAIESMGWKEKSYLSVKKELVAKLASMPTVESAAYLKDLYHRAGDTAELQYAALETLLSQQTADAYQAFATIMQYDPPVLDKDDGDKSYVSDFPQSSWRKGSDYNPVTFNGSFFDNLTDSLELTAGIIKSMLPLLTVNDYQQPVMAVLGALADSNLIRAADYESYLPKFILETKQMLKKQLIREKAKAIEKARKDDEEKKTDIRYDGEENDYGNRQLSLYATLIVPFWDRNPQVKPLMEQLLNSKDRRLRYNTAMLLLRNKRAVADTLLASFAALDEFRHELYTDLTNMGREEQFPSAWKSQEKLAKSWLATVQLYNKPDTIAFMQKLPVQYKEWNGLIYFFKYKEKEEDNTWKLAAAGIYPEDSTVLTCLPGGGEGEDEIDFTALSTTKLTAETTETAQLEKFKKRLVNSRRKSAARFYEEGNRYENFDFMWMK